jgi:hypothetical protein
MALSQVSIVFEVGIESMSLELGFLYKDNSPILGRGSDVLLDEGIPMWEHILCNCSFYVIIM